MDYENRKITDLKIAYIGGGSRGWAWRLMGDLAMEPALSGTVALYDIDRDAADRNERIGNNLGKQEGCRGKWHYAAAASLKEALTGADFIIISILPGTFDEMAVDVHCPEKYGIWQSVGDTAGPGGIVRALRTIPMFVEIGEAIKSYAPKAWVINYTNPMSLCVKTLYRVFPDIKAFGCCHEVFGTQKLLKNICEKMLGITDINRDEIHVNVLGINHFTWFSEASFQGVDLFHVYEAFINKNYEHGLIEDEKHWMNSSFASSNRVKFDLFRRFSWIAAAGDRHLAEFMPGDEYLKNPETVKSWGFKLTTVDWRKEDLKKRLEKSSRLIEGKEKIELKPSGEEGVRLIKSICGLERMISNVNIPNKAKQISNLPENAIVETNAVFSRDSIKPVYAGKLPEKILSLIEPHIKNHELVLDAAMNCSFDSAFKAFMNDPLVKAKCTQEEGKKLLYEMIERTSGYLPKRWMI